MKTILFLSGMLRKIGGLLLLGMMLLTVADIVGGFFGAPILGAEELTALMASVLLAFALTTSLLDNAHVGVDLLYLKMPSRAKKINDVFISFVSLALFSFIGWQCFLYAQELRGVGEVSMTLQFPTYLLIYGIAFAF